jgi:hypothetical protein
MHKPIPPENTQHSISQISNEELDRQQKAIELARKWYGPNNTAAEPIPVETPEHQKEPVQLSLFPLESAEETPTKKTFLARFGFSGAPAIILCVLLLCSTIALSVLFIRSRDTISSLQIENSNLNSEVSKLIKDYNRLVTNYNSKRDTYNFFNHGAVIVPANSSMYHYIFCSRCDLSYGYYIFNVEYADGFGYERCPICGINWARIENDMPFKPKKYPPIQ